MANQVHAAAEVGATVTLQCFTYNFTVLQLDCEKGTCFQWYKVRVLAKNFAMMASAGDETMVTKSESIAMVTPWLMFPKSMFNFYNAEEWAVGIAIHVNKLFTRVQSC